MTVTVASEDLVDDEDTERQDTAPHPPSRRREATPHVPRPVFRDPPRALTPRPALGVLAPPRPARAPTARRQLVWALGIAGLAAVTAAVTWALL